MSLHASTCNRYANPPTPRSVDRHLHGTVASAGVAEALGVTPHLIAPPPSTSPLVMEKNVAVGCVWRDEGGDAKYLGSSKLPVPSSPAAHSAPKFEAEEEGAAIFDAPSSRLFARRGSNAALPGSPEVAPATPRSQETPQTPVEPGAGVPPVHRSGDLAPLNKKGSGALRPTSQFDWGLAS